MASKATFVKDTENKTINITINRTPITLSIGDCITFQYQEDGTLSPAKGIIRGFGLTTSGNPGEIWAKFTYDSPTNNYFQVIIPLPESDKPVESDKIGDWKTIAICPSQLISISLDQWTNVINKTKTLVKLPIHPIETYYDVDRSIARDTSHYTGAQAKKILESPNIATPSYIFIKTVDNKYYQLCKSDLIGKLDVDETGKPGKLQLNRIVDGEKKYLITGSGTTDVNSDDIQIEIYATDGDIYRVFSDTYEEQKKIDDKDKEDDKDGYPIHTFEKVMKDIGKDVETLKKFLGRSPSEEIIKGKLVRNVTGHGVSIETDDATSLQDTQLRAPFRYKLSFNPEGHYNRNMGELNALNAKKEEIRKQQAEIAKQKREIQLKRLANATPAKANNGRAAVPATGGKRRKHTHKKRKSKRKTHRKRR